MTTPEPMACPLPPDPGADAKVWVLRKLAEHIKDGCGSFRTMIYDYLDMDYSTAYLAGGMEVSNALSSEEDFAQDEAERAALKAELAALRCDLDASATEIMRLQGELAEARGAVADAKLLLRAALDIDRDTHFQGPCMGEFIFWVGDVRHTVPQGPDGLPTLSPEARAALEAKP